HSPTRTNPQMGWSLGQSLGLSIGLSPRINAYWAFIGAQWASNNTKMPILGRFISNADSSSIFEYLNYRLRPKLTESLWELSQSIGRIDHR
ncbi:hypothetical protein ACN38_g13006, partial [Penicillium nordicum]